MDEQQAKNLGSVLKERREALGLSLKKLGDKVGLPDVTILRFEHGEYAAPAPDKLARVAEALGLSLADVYALADYAVPSDLPSFTPYLRTKYRDLPQDEVDKPSRPTPRSSPRSTASISRTSTRRGRELTLSAPRSHLQIAKERIAPQPRPSHQTKGGTS